MKKVVYNLYQISPLDIGVGPSKFARFEGIEAVVDGHGMQMSLYKRIFTETRLEVAKELNKNVTDKEVLAEARHRVRVNRYEPDKKSSQIENSGAVEYAGVQQFTVVDGHARYINPDGSLSEYTFESFHERQLNDPHPDTRSKYSKESHHTDILLSSTIVDANKYIEVTKIAHDSRGVRDAYTYVYDPATKRGFIRVKNMAPDGKNMSPSEAREKMKSIFRDRQEIRAGNDISVLVKSKQPVDSIKVQTIYERTIRQTLEIPTYVGKAVYAETKNTVSSVDSYVQQTYGKRLQDIPMMVGDVLIHRVRRMLEHKEHQKGEKAAIKEVNLIGRSLEKVKDTQTKIREKIIVSTTALVFVRATGVGIGGVSEILREMRKIPDISVESPKQSKKEKTRKQKRILEKMRTFRKSETFKKLIKRERRIFRRKEKKLKQKFVLEKMRVLRKTEVFKILAKKEKRLFRRKEKVLWKMLKRLVQKTERSVVPKKIKQKEKLQKITVAKKEIRQTKKQEKQHVKDFSIALIIWLLLRPPEKRREVKVTKNEKLTKLVPKKQTPWLLLVIIWHLAMIREGGNRTVYKQKKAKKQARQYYSASIPPQGVIFAFPS